MEHHVYVAIFKDSSVFFTAREVDNPPDDSEASYEWAIEQKEKGQGSRPLVAKTIEFNGQSENTIIARSLDENEAEELKSDLIRHFRETLPKGRVLNVRVSRPECSLSPDVVKSAVQKVIKCIQSA
ncbi:hypothetical protein ACE1GQ_001208 [Vibrio fluvialis]